MSKYRRSAIFFLLIEIFIFAIVFFVGIRDHNATKAKQYNVDISRVAGRMEDGEALSDICLEEYSSLISVEQFDLETTYVHEYKVKSIDGILYCFQYKEDRSNMQNWIIVFVAGIILSNVILLIYIDRKLLSPFNKMNELTTELAKGNLATPIKQEKNRYFGRFLWGMDMLRETLEDNKKRELELIKEKKTLILSLSHDIKTPLSAIDLYSKALKKGLYESDEEKKVAYDGINKNVLEIKRYVNEISKASREDFLMLETKNGELYLLNCLEHVRAYYADKMKRLRIDFAMASPEDCLIYGDEDRLIEVMQNCIENAIKYGDGKRIYISFTEEEDCKLITVANSGCQLAKDELTHIFDSFYRGSNSENEEGSGLGLYICKQLMQKMDGDIFAKIAGDEFQITLVVKKVM